MKTEEEYKAEVLQLMRDLYPTLKGEEKERAERLFPELKESEDERMKRVLTEGFAILSKDEEWYDGVTVGQILAWFEKRGEQNPTDKVEHKFKVGDWVVYECGEETATLQIKGIVDKTYVFSDDSTLGVVDEDTLRLWTIQDAKDGDLIYVSTEEKGIQAIFREYKNQTIFFHCYLCYDFVQGGYTPIDSVKLMYPLQETHYKRFFEKMDEAGYTWNVEELKLEEIEQKPVEKTDVLMSLDEAIKHCKGKSCGNNACALEHKQLEKWLTELKELKEQKQELSEEDIAVLDALIRRLEGEDLFVSTHLAVSCLKRLKEKVHPKEEQHEEDRNPLT